MRVLTVNAGSSSLKLRLLGPDNELIASADLGARGGRADALELERWLTPLEEVDAVGHRIVHGGTRFRSAVRIDDAVIAGLRELTDLAPLHQPKSLEALDLVRAVLPDVPAVACFDTSFHATMPAAAATYALARDLYRGQELRRYGFHGLSHAYASRRAAAMIGEPLEELRIVTCHLGAGASLAAVRGGKSVDTTMGFTPLEGLVMATRSGSVDPGLLLWLLEHERIGSVELADALEHRSGLLGLAGTDDMRQVLERAGKGDTNATLALGVYVHRLRAGISSMAAAMDGLDAIVFTGGVGENAPEIRAAAVEGLGFLGLALDGELNSAARTDAEVGASEATARTLLVTSREDVEIAAEVRVVLDADPARG